MKKKLLIIIPLIILGIIILIIKLNNKSIEKFYLEDKYYHNDSVISIDASSLEKIKKESYLLFVYNNFCRFQIPCEDIFETFTKENKIAILAMPFDEFKSTNLYHTVKYAPSVIVVKEGKIVAYLDAEKDEDVPKYQDTAVFTNWLSNYIYLDK